MPKILQQEARIQELRVRKNRLDDLEEFKFTDQKFEKWCQQHKKDRNLIIKPKYLVTCQECNKIYNDEQFRKHKYEHKQKKGKYILLPKFEGQYLCNVKDCKFQPSKDREQIIRHFLDHNEQELLSINIKPQASLAYYLQLFQDVFKGQQLEQYSGLLINQKIKKTPNYYELYVNQLLVEENQEKDEKLDDENIEEQINTLQNCNNQIEQDESEELNKKQFYQTLFPEIQQFMDELFQDNLVIKSFGKLDLKLQDQKKQYQNYKFTDLLDNKHEYDNFWSQYKFMKLFKLKQLKYQNQILGAKLENEEIITITRSYQVTLKTILNKRIDQQLLNLAMLGMLQSIQELHENDIVHRDIKPDNFLIDNDTEFQIFLRNYKYCIKRNDISNSRPSPNNKYINSQLKLTSGNKYWDIYSAALIILEYFAGRGKFKFINEKKLEVKKRVEAFLKKFVQHLEIKKLLYRVLVKRDPEVQISDLLQCFYSLAK